jgi:hypothetical protein
LGKSLEFYRVRVNDVNCDYVIATGDCNDNQECVNSRMKRICTSYSLEQLITDPTNFAEHSSSILDLIVTNSIDFVPYTGVIPPLLDRIRYHCPVFGIINCPKSVHKCFMRKIWLYDRGDYDKYRRILSNIDWNDIFSTDAVDLVTATTTKRVWLIN